MCYLRSALHISKSVLCIITLLIHISCEIYICIKENNCYALQARRCTYCRHLLMNLVLVQEVTTFVVGGIYETELDHF